MRKKKNLTQVTLIVILIILSVKCRTFPKELDNVIFPTPPNPKEVEIKKDADNKTVTIPYWWWIKLADFYVDYESALERLDLYEGKQ